MEKEHIKKIGLIVVGIILALIILELGLRLGGFVIMSMQRAGNKVSNDQEESYRILGLGESTTAEIYTEESSWPSQLKIVLNERNPELKFEVFNEGVPSVSTDFILSVLEDELLDKYKPDMIIIMTGINDELAQCFQCNNITPSNKILSFFRNFRIYKLSRLIYLHLENKIRNTRAKGINLSKMDYERYDKNMIKRIINKKPTNDEEYVELGAAYKSIGYIKEASEAFAKAIEVNPENYYAYVELGNYYKGMREFDRAEKMFKKAIEMNPEKTYAYIELAYFYETQDRMDEAREVYQQAIEVNPESYDALIAFAVYYMEQNKSKEAEDILKRAIEVKENNYDAYVEVGRLYNVLG